MAEDNIVVVAIKTDNRRNYYSNNHLRGLCQSIIELLLWCSCFLPLNCRPLEPLPQLNEEVEAKLNLDTGKLLKQLLGNGEVSYRQATQDTLKNYPKSDQANVCEWMIYLASTLLDGSQDDSAKKVEVVNNLMQNCNSYRMEAVRPEKGSGHSKTLEGFSKTVAGFRIDMRQCYRVNEQDACCDFLITSEGKDRLAQFYAENRLVSASRAIDNIGQAYPANSLQVGEYITDVVHNAFSFSLNNTLPADIPVLSRACFKKISTKANQFALFELLFRDLTESPNSGFITTAEGLIRAKILAIPLQDKESQ